MVVDDTNKAEKDKLQKVLGNLNLDGDTLKKFEQLASIEKEAIAKQVVSRQLSIIALTTETKNLKEFTSGLLRMGKNLEQLQSINSFKFNAFKNVLQNFGSRLPTYKK